MKAVVSCRVLVGALARKKASFQKAALAALKAAVCNLPGDHIGQVSEPLLAMVERHRELDAAPSGQEAAVRALVSCLLISKAKIRSPVVSVFLCQNRIWYCEMCDIN
jgi:hypothetical protein